MSKRDGFRTVLENALRFIFEVKSPIGRPGVRCFGWLLEDIGWDSSVGIASRYRLLMQDTVL